MIVDLKEFLSRAGTIPLTIGAYNFSRAYDPGDGSTQISYLSKEYGHFTITFYKDEESDVPEDLNHPVIMEEFEECINDIYRMEEEGTYQNVELLVKDEFVFSDDEMPLFQSAVFQFQIFNKIEQMIEHNISILWIRGDGGYFHKVRFSAAGETAEESFTKMEEFLAEWMSFVQSAGRLLN